jgi:hypothetical protein
MNGVCPAELGGCLELLFTLKHGIAPNPTSQAPETTEHTASCTKKVLKGYYRIELSKILLQNGRFSLKIQHFFEQKNSNM